MHSFLQLVQEIKTAYDREDNAVLANIEDNIESTATASVPHAVGTYLVYNKVIYEVTDAIDTGDTLTPGTNITVASDIMSKIATLQSRVAGVENGLSTAESNISTLTTGLSTEITQRQAAVGSLQETLTNQINYNGAKNLFSLKDFSNETFYGVTYSYSQETGTLTKSGTSSGAGGINYDVIDLPQGEYILSGDFSGETGEQTSIYLREVDTGTTVGRIYRVTPSLQLTLSGKYYIRIATNVGTTGGSIKNIMLRLASDTDSTFEPYAKTNQQLTRETTGLLDNVNQNGAKNLYASNMPTITKVGVTATAQSDGSYSFNGTANSQGDFYLSTESGGSTISQYQDIPAGSYKLNGISGGSQSTYRLYIALYNKITATTTFVAGNDGDIDVEIGENIAVSVFLRVYANAVLNNIVIKPMLRLASDPDNTYVPYAMTNRELTDVAEQIEEKYVTASFNDSVQVTADGVKTTQALITELRQAFNTYVQSSDKYIEIDRLLFNDIYYSVTGVSVGRIFSASTPYSSSSISFYTIRIVSNTQFRLEYITANSTESSSNRRIQALADAELTDVSASVLSSGTTLTLTFRCYEKIS